MKKLISVILLLSALILTSCAGNTDTEASSDTAASTETNASTEMWSIGTEKKCNIHHMDYHIIPFELVMYAGEDAANEWAKECQRTSAEADSKCPYSTYNIKAFIEKFNIPREVFAAKADLAHYAVFDCEMLYTDTAENIEKYFTDRAALADESIKVQNFAFLERYFISEYTNTVMDMIIPDSTGSHGTSPSVPQIVQAVGMSRQQLEEVIAQMNDRTVEVCGKLMVYDYDLDLIYNEDVSFKELPVFEGLTEYESVQKYDSLFCQRGE